MGNDKTFYLCNGCNDEECLKTDCYKQGGPCRHTSNVKYAKNPFGERKFKKLPSGDYWEIEKKN